MKKNGCYDEDHAVTDAKINLNAGQKENSSNPEYLFENKRKIELSSYMSRETNLFPSDAETYVKGLRSDDRL